MFNHSYDKFKKDLKDKLFNKIFLLMKDVYLGSYI